MSTTVAQNPVIAKTENGAEAVMVENGYVIFGKYDEEQDCMIRRRFLLDLEDAITVARAVLAFAHEPSQAELEAQARYETWIDEQAAKHQCITAIHPDAFAG